VSDRAGEHDVVVVGGGPAGSATAALLANGGWDVLLLDRARFPRPKPCAETLSPGAVKILSRLGAFRFLARDSGRWLRGMELSAPGGGHALVHYGDGERALAVPREPLDLALLRLARSRGAHVVEGFRVADVLVSDGAARGVVGYDLRGRPSEWRARLVVGADGAHSVVARRLCRRVTRSWLRRLGLVTHVAGVPWPEEHGEMHVGRRGYVGVAPLAEDVVSVGLVMPLPRGRIGHAELAVRAALGDYPELAGRLARGHMGPVRGIGPMAARVHPCAGPGFALAGDAAGFLDPFTGEGIFRALWGAEILARLADRALRAPDPAVDLGAQLVRARRAAFRTKELLTLLVQVFVHIPPLMDYALDRLHRRPELATQLGRVLGDLEPARDVLRSPFMWRLLRP